MLLDVTEFVQRLHTKVGVLNCPFELWSAI